MGERKLKAWVAAGLIDGATASRIRDWEAQHSRPLALWAVVGIAALSIGLGVISLVAANWDAIPGETRLALHAALMVAMAGVLWGIRDQPGRRSWPLFDAGIFVLGLLGLAFLGHLGQVYQTTSPAWLGVAVWLALFAPVLLTQGQGWLTASMMVAGAVGLAWSRAENDEWGHTLTSHSPALIRTTVECVAPMGLAVIAAWCGVSGSRGEFWRRLGQLTVAYAVATVTLLVIFSAFEDWAAHDEGGVVRTALGTAALLLGGASVSLWRLNRTTGGAAAGAALGLSGLVLIAAYPLSGGGLAAGLLFLGFWAGLALAALHAEHRGLFQMAVAIFALRLIILSFEEAGGLLMSGAGLIAGGVLTLTVAWTAMRLSRAFAPNRRGQR